MTPRPSAAEMLMRRVERGLRMLGMSDAEIAELRRRATDLATEQLAGGEIRIDKCPACAGAVEQLEAMPHRTRDDRTIHQTVPCGHAVLVTFEPIAGDVRVGRHVRLTRP